MSMKDEKNRVAIVTGASRGIGAEVARRLAKDGFGVVLDYAIDVASAAALAQEIATGGGHVVALRADVRDPEAVRHLFDVAEMELGGVDVLVNSAGVMTLAPLSETDDATFDRMIAVNLKGTFNTMREGARRLRRGGRIINLSTSVIGLRLPNYAAYAATKAGVEALTSILAQELRGREITVNSVAPGPTATELFLRGKSDEIIERLTKAPPLERLGRPSDIAGVVSFLAGPDGGWVNGQTLRVNGGIV